MALFGDDYGGSGGLGGLGGGMNNFLNSPLTLAALQMLSNNTPKINQIPDTFNNVPQVLASASAMQRKNQEQDLSQNAIAAALEQAGFSKEDANKYKYNPAAANIVLDQLKQKQQDAAYRENIANRPPLFNPDDAGTSESAPQAPPAPAPQSALPAAPDNSPNMTALATLARANSQVGDNRYSDLAPPAQSSAQAQAFTPPPAPAQQAPAQAQAAQAPAQALPQIKTSEDASKFVTGFKSDFPDTIRDTLSDFTLHYGSSWANTEMGQALKEGNYPKAKELLPATVAKLETEKAQAPAQARAPVDADFTQQSAPRQQVAQAAPPQTGPVTQRAIAQREAMPMPAQPAQGAPAPAPQAEPQQAETVTQRALAQREAARLRSVQQQIRYEENTIENPRLSASTKEAAKLRLQNLQKEMEATPDIREYREYVGQQNATKQPIVSFMDFKKQMKGPLVSIDNKQESSYGTHEGARLSKKNEEISDAAAKAQNKLATINQMESLLKAPNLYTGKGGTLTAEVAGWAKVLGIDVGNLPAAQAVKAITNQFALDLRDPSSGSGMPGALSDGDRKFLSSMTPGLENVPAANALLIDYMKRKEQRTIDIEEMRQDYLADPANKGQLNEGFFKKVRTFAKENPLFTDQDRETVKAITMTSAPPPPASARNGIPPVKVGSPETARKLPSGTPIILPDGRTGVVP